MGTDYPLAPRVLAGAGALGVGVWFGAATPAALLQAGYPYSAAAMAVTVLPLVAFLGLLAVAPDMLQRILSRFTRVNLRDGGHVGAVVIMAGTLFFVLGFGAVANGVYAFERVYGHGDTDVLQAVDATTLFQSLLLNAVLLTLPVLLYVSFVHGLGPRAALRALGLHGDGLGRALLIGAGAALLFLALLAAASALVAQSVGEIPENELALAIAKSLTPLGALGLAIGSSVSEEVFFRGFLQPRVGFWWQAVIFGVAHLSYANVTEVVVVTLLALAFGWIYRRTGNLWAPIAAHFTFNLLMLLAGIYAPAS